MELRCTFHVISSDLRCYPILYIAATLWRVQLTCNCRAVSEDRPEADLLATVTVLSLIGHVVAEKGADSAPRCLRLVREIVATPGDAFAVRLAVISDSLEQRLYQGDAGHGLVGERDGARIQSDRGAGRTAGDRSGAVGRR